VWKGVNSQRQLAWQGVCWKTRKQRFISNKEEEKSTERRPNLPPPAGTRFWERGRIEDGSRSVVQVPLPPRPRRRVVAPAAMLAVHVEVVADNPWQQPRIARFRSETSHAMHHWVQEAMQVLVLPRSCSLRPLYEPCDRPDPNLRVPDEKSDRDKAAPVEHKGILISTKTMTQPRGSLGVEDARQRGNITARQSDTLTCTPPGAGPFRILSEGS